MEDQESNRQLSNIFLVSCDTLEQYYDNLLLGFHPIMASRNELDSDLICCGGNAMRLLAEYLIVQILK